MRYVSFCAHKVQTKCPCKCHKIGRCEKFENDLATCKREAKITRAYGRIICATPLPPMLYDAGTDIRAIAIRGARGSLNGSEALPARERRSSAGGLLNRALNFLPMSPSHVPKKKRTYEVHRKPFIFLVGMRGFEPPASASRTLRSSQTEPHPATGNIFTRG